MARLAGEKERLGSIYPTNGEALGRNPKNKKPRSGVMPMCKLEVAATRAAAGTKAGGNDVFTVPPLSFVPKIPSS